MTYVLDSVTLDELEIRPLGPNHVVTIDSLLLTVEGRLMVQKKVTTLSLMNRLVKADNSTLGGGTVKCIRAT